MKIEDVLLEKINIELGKVENYIHDDECSDLLDQYDAWKKDQCFDLVFTDSNDNEIEKLKIVAIKIMELNKMIYEIKSLRESRAILDAIKIAKNFLGNV